MRMLRCGLDRMYRWRARWTRSFSAMWGSNKADVWIFYLLMTKGLFNKYKTGHGRGAGLSGSSFFSSGFNETYKRWHFSIFIFQTSQFDKGYRVSHLIPVSWMILLGIFQLFKSDALLVVHLLSFPDWWFKAVFIPKSNWSGRNGNKVCINLWLADIFHRWTFLHPKRQKSKARLVKNWTPNRLFFFKGASLPH